MLDKTAVRVAVAARLLALLPWPTMLILGTQSGLEWPVVAGIAATAHALWSLVFAGSALTLGRFADWSLVVETIVTVTALIVGGWACFPHDATSWANFAVTPAMVSVVLVSASWPAKRSTAITATIVAGYLLGLGRSLEAGAGAWDVAGVNVVTLVVLSLAGAQAGRLIRTRTAATDLADRTGRELADARAWMQRQSDLERERARQYRMLHDTVLSTLSAMARGGLDPADPAVRQRCAADADYLRALISSGGVSAGNRLQGELAMVGRAQGALGLRVHLHSSDLPSDLPAEAVRALADAAREALNNVVKHSGTQQAWITAVAGDDPGSVLVTVTDQGAGFDAAGTRFGLGLRDSIDRRMVEAGGSSTVDSSPGQGTSVELRWPA